MEWKETMNRTEPFQNEIDEAVTQLYAHAYHLSK